MKTFNDAEGRTWTLALTLGSALAVRAKLDIDLLQPEQGDPPLLTRLGTEPLLLAETILTLIEGQIDAAGIDRNDVLRAFDGATFQAIIAAWWQEYADFFHNAGRPDQATLVRKGRLVAAEAVRQAATNVESMDVCGIVCQAMAETPGPPRGAPPAPSASIPGA